METAERLAAERGVKVLGGLEVPRPKQPLALFDFRCLALGKPLRSHRFHPLSKPKKHRGGLLIGRSDLTATLSDHQKEPVGIVHLDAPKCDVIIVRLKGI